MPDWKREIQQRLTASKLEPTREAAIVEELSQYLDDCYDELLASGVSEAESYRRTLEELSGSETLERELWGRGRRVPQEPLVPGTNRRANMIADLRQDLRYGARMLLKQPGVTLIAILTISLGIGANTVIFSLVNSVLLRPLPYAEPERLIRVFENFKERGLNFVDLTAPGFMDWRAQQTVFEDIAAYQAIGFDLTGAGEAQRVLGMRASAGLLPLLRIQPALGRNFTAAEDVFGKGRVAILSHRLWQERFNGANDVLGKSLTLNGEIYSIIGVLPARLRLTGFANADVWVPIAFERWELESRGSHN